MTGTLPAGGELQARSPGDGVSCSGAPWLWLASHRPCVCVVICGVPAAAWVRPAGGNLKATALVSCHEEGKEAASAVPCLPSLPFLLMEGKEQVSKGRY